MSSLSYEDVELEFMIKTKVHIVTQNGKRKLKIDATSNFLAYQNWSIKTRALNKMDRLVFPVTCNQLHNAASNYKDYKPTVVFSTEEKERHLFSINKFSMTQDKNTLVMVLDDDVSYGSIPDDGIYKHARLNLSTMPYHLLNNNNTLDIFPKSDIVQEKHTFNNKNFSFLLETKTNSIVTEDGISKIIIKKNTPLYAYEQWSANNKLRDDGKKTVKKMTWSEALKNSDEYEMKMNDKFTPTVLLEIDKKTYIGIITSVDNVDHSENHKNLNMEDSIDLVITIDTNRMKKKDDSNEVVSLPEIPSISTETSIYMNIDDTTSVEEITEIPDDNIIQSNQIYNINQDTNTYLVINNDTSNYGKISISSIDLSSDTSPIEILDASTELVNYGEINVTMDNDFELSGLSTFFKGGRIKNTSTGIIDFNTSDSSNTLTITRSKGSNQSNFTFIESIVVNFGVLRLNSMINNSSLMTVTGIKLVETNETEEVRNDSNVGSIFFAGLKSNVDLSKLSLFDNENITVGIEECRHNTGAIMFDRIENGDSSDISGINKSHGNLCQTTIAIRKMGALGGKAQYKGVSFKLTNPRYNSYGVMNDEPDESQNQETSVISGCAKNSVIFINTIVNNSASRNSLALVGACGIFNLIQTHTSALVHINSITNNGYGGMDACCGIMNLLVNYGNVSLLDVNNSCQLDYDNHSHSITYGIAKVIQNGYALGEGDPLSNARSYLPPFPPKHYNNKGTPTDLEDENYVTSILKYVGSENFASKSMYNSLVRKYTQGHISIHKVSTVSYNNELSIGIGQYGGLSFTSDIMEDDGENLPIDITIYMQKYVHKYTPLSIVWSYPTDTNTSWTNTNKSNYLEQMFPKDPYNGYLGKRELDEELEKIGWHWNFSNPVQMYYKYESNTDNITDSIFFPINWGVVTIDYVLSGGDSPVKDSAILGSSYGIEKAITSMGNIQIDLIESNIRQHYLDLTTEQLTLVNTNDNPEISKMFYGGNDDATTYLSMPANYIQNEAVTEVNYNSINDLPITLTMENPDISDPESRIDGIWTTGTQTNVNYCWPYHITPKNQHDGSFHHVDPNNLKAEFTLPSEQEDNLEFPSSFPADNLLDALSSPGAAFGVYRTIDYGSCAPGLTFMMSFTQPIETESKLSTWNRDDTWASFECEFKFKPNSYVTTDELDLDRCHVTQDIVTIGATFDDNNRISRNSINAPGLSELTPIPNSLAKKNSFFYWSVVRAPATQDPPFKGCDYMHYPFMSDYNQGKNVLGLSQYIIGVDRYIDFETMWVNWKYINGVNRYTMNSNGELNNYLEEPFDIPVVTKWAGDLDLTETYFSDPQNNNTLFIYNCSLLNSKLKLKYYKNVYSSEDEWTLPNPDNIFNGLTPFPLIPSSGSLSEFSNLNYMSRCFQGKISVPEKIVWNASSYRFTSSVKAKYTPEYPPESQRKDDKNWHGRNYEYDWLMPDDEKRAQIHDTMLQKMYNYKIPEDTDGFKFSNFFNLLKSSWPYSSAVKELMDFYYGDDDYLPSHSGKSGPINSVFFTNRSGDNINNVADLLCYNYSPTLPIGFNPQLIQGGLYKLETQHPDYENVSRENGGASSFLVVSKGKEHLTSLVDLNQYEDNITFDHELMTHESDFFGKYQTNNRYYGFIFENRNPRSKVNYVITQMLLGPYNRYKNILDMVNNLIYINAEAEDEYQKNYIEFKVKQAQKSVKEEKEKEEREKAMAANIGLMIALPFIMPLIGALKGMLL
jgi:hypothetical protein